MVIIMIMNIPVKNMNIIMNILEIIMNILGTIMNILGTTINIIMDIFTNFFILIKVTKYLKVDIMELTATTS